MLLLCLLKIDLSDLGIGIVVLVLLRLLLCFIKQNEQKGTSDDQTEGKDRNEYKRP